jgi:GDPmannose 4,6-dehydratase
MKKTALITGITGQDGSYLAQYLLDNDYRVYGFVRRHTKINFDNIDYFKIRDNIDYVIGDLLDECSINHAINTIRPTELYGLAAQTFVGASWDLSKWTTEVNCVGTLNILNGIKAHSPNTRYLQAASSEMFGNVKQDLRSETTPFNPCSPYGVSKLYGYWMTVNYRQSYGLHASNAILFNHESPIRGKEFVTRKITDAVARIHLGKQDKVILGNLDVTRDWGYAGDFVKAYHRILQQDTPDDFVLATGVSHSIRELLTIAFAEVGILDWKKYVVLDPLYSRPTELHNLRGDITKAKTMLQWEPSIDFKELISKMVAEDIKRVKNGN